MKTVFEQMADRNAEENIEKFRQFRMMDYEHKVYHAEDVAQAYVNECREREMNCHVSVGGLDSITLYLFLRDLGKRRHINELRDIPGITVSVLEDKSLQRVHQDLGRVPRVSGGRTMGTRLLHSQPCRRSALAGYHRRSGPPAPAVPGL